MIEFQISSGVGWLWLNRPERRNAISLSMLDDFAEHVSTLKSRDIGALIIIGKGPAFCSGLDIADMSGASDELARRGGNAEDPVAAGVRDTQAIIAGIASLPYPTIAAMRGSAVGGGLELAMACDVRIATPDARMAMREVCWGLVPDWGGSYFLPRYVGLGRARSMIVSGEQVAADEAVRIGLVDRVVDVGRLESEAAELAAQLAALPAAAITEARKLLIDGGHRSLSDSLAAEADAQSRRLAAAEFTARADAVRRRVSPS